MRCGRLVVVVSGALAAVVLVEGLFQCFPATVWWCWSFTVVCIVVSVAVEDRRVRCPFVALSREWMESCRSK